MGSTSKTSEYAKLLQTLGGRLLTEQAHSKHQLRGMTHEEIRELVQHLLVTRRPPREVSPEEEELYVQVDRLLELEKRRQVFTDAHALPAVGGPDQQPWHQMVLWKGDITTLRATAIVNAANVRMLGCFEPTHRCIDNVIHCKAGPRLRTACHDLMVAQGEDEPVGAAKITPAFALPSSYVIHTVGPQLQHGHAPTEEEKQQLQSSYTSSLDLLLQTLDGSSSVPNATIAFPCISTGLFAFPSDIGTPLAVDAVLDWLKRHPEASSWTVIFNVFLQNDYDLYRRHFETHCPGANCSAPISNPLLDQAAALIQEADYLLIAAGAGLSAAAGLDYTSQEVMKKYHPTMHERGLLTMYHLVGREDLPDEFFLGYYLKQISIARFGWPSRRTAPTYPVLKSIRDHFESRTPESTLVITTNGDGMFVQEGFPVESVCTLQGDYSFLVCRAQCTSDSYFDITPFIENGRKYMDPETYVLAPEGLPKCPKCGGELGLFLERWFHAKHTTRQKEVYNKWLATVQEQVTAQKKKLVILEFGLGFNTPEIIRLPVERLATQEGVNLIRVNPHHSEMPFETFGVSIACDANEALNHFAQKVVVTP